MFMADSDPKGSPNAARLHFQEGCRLLEAGDPAAAIQALSLAAAGAPEDGKILATLANALFRAGRTTEAFHAYNRRIALGDVTAENWCDIGHALAKMGEYAQAMEAYENSIACRSDYAEAHHHLGQACFNLGDIDRAMQHLQIAANQSQRLASWLAMATIAPGAPQADLKALLAVRRRFAERLENERPFNLLFCPPQIVSRGKKLQVGYLSAFFSRANYMKPVWALINNHDRRRFAVHLFSDGPETDMEGYARHPEDQLHPVGNLSNDDLAHFMAQCGIEVLVDLNGYSFPKRLGLFLTPPAPVCVAWFNMYATSGLPGFHYIVGDDEVVSDNDVPYFSETVIRLPVSYLTFTVTHRAPPVVDPPCLETGTITFGSLVAQYKINAQVISAWARILNQAGNSRLMIANRAMDAAENQAWLKKRFSDLGVGADRLSFLGSAPHYRYLQYYDRFDIALDAFPYNGGTTTMEAIWQGVPVLTFAGDRWASRTSQTLLRRTHLSRFVARDRDAMIDAAVGLAVDDDVPEMLLHLRRTMRERLRRSPACDAAALTRSMERFFESARDARAGAGGA